MLRRWFASALVTLALTAPASLAQRALVPDSVPLSEPAAKAIDAPWLTDEERAALRVDHGVWKPEDLLDATLRARVALNAWRFDDPVLADPAVPVEIRAEARLRAGDLEGVLELTEGVASLRAIRIRAQAYEGLGRYAEARGAISPVVRALLDDRIDDADDLTDGVRCLALRARIEGQPARDYTTMMKLLGRAHQDLDRLCWSARLAEAELLREKSNRQEAVAALHETLALNPRCSEAWYALGQIALRVVDFDSAQVAIAALERIDADHPLAALLFAESRLVQNDPEEALHRLARLIERWPRMRPALALTAAGSALLYRTDEMNRAFAAFDALSPGGADAHYAAGRFLAMFRQYDLAADVLEEAIRRRPKWPAPQLELGLMEMQTGRDDKALDILRALVELDPFDARAANSLFLLEELIGYERIETENFIIRYEKGLDEVVVDLMPETLERIYDRVTGRFGWPLREKTIIEVMPDHQRFAVRITGMPHVHTIAACTGPIIAMEVPREGAPNKHLGTFDWARVLQHEFTHTVTLDQTNFRIPHWLTEGAAVRMEDAPRDEDDCRMLAASYRDGTLFDLDEIKWAFVRPRLPGDRGKAYAQGAWMVEFMDERFGPETLVELLARYFEGKREVDAVPEAIGISREAFYEQFLAWAGEQVAAWGLAAEPSLEALEDELRRADPELAIVMAASEQARLEAIAETMARQIGAAKGPRDRRLTAAQWPPVIRPPVEVTDEQLAAWRRENPDHPDLLREALERRIADGETDGAALIADLERLAALCPIDLFPHRRLAAIHLASDERVRAIPHLERLDAHEQKSLVFAWELARLYRAQGDAPSALAKATRAVNINPYRPESRELAAAVAIEAGRLDLARLHIKALALLEPEHPAHQKRLDRIDALLSRGG